MEKVKHGGCADCGTKNQEILWSTNVPGSVVGLALCDRCREKRAKGGEK
jgi:hypothetical protein